MLVPPSLISCWIREAKEICKGYTQLKGHLDVMEYSSKHDRKKRDRMLRQIRKKGTPLLVIGSNGLFQKIDEPINNPIFPTGRDFGCYWDIFVVDEAHSRAKSKTTVLGKALRNKRSKLLEESFVLLLTATPLQNKIEV